MASHAVFAVNGVVIDLENELLIAASGTPIRLRRQSYAVLRYLHRQAGRLVTKEDLAQAVWPGIAVTDDSLVQCIHEIRVALGDEAHAIVKTVRGRGYRLVLPEDGSDTVVTKRHAIAGIWRHFRQPALLAAALVWLAVALAPAAIDMSMSDTRAKGPGLPAETTNQEAHDALLLGLQRLRLGTEADTVAAIGHFERAAKYDPQYGRSYAAIAAAQQRMIESGWLTMAGIDLDRAHKELQANLAKTKQRPSALGYVVMANQARHSDRIADAYALIEKAKALEPNQLEVLLGEAALLNATGRAVKAEAVLRQAMIVDPEFSPVTLRLLSVAVFQQGRYSEASAIVERIAAQGAATMGDYITQVASLGHLDAVEGVADAVARYNELAIPAGRDLMSVQEAQWHWHDELISYHPAYVGKLTEGLRLAGIPEGAGTDLPFAAYQSLIKRDLDGEFTVAGVTEIGAPAAGSLFDRGVRFVDVRPRASYKKGHVPGAINLSLATELSREELNKVAPPDDYIVFYCNSRYCDESALAAAKAVRWGYKRVFRMRGGMPAWKKADCPTEMASR